MISSAPAIVLNGDEGNHHILSSLEKGYARRNDLDGCTISEAEEKRDSHSHSGSLTAKPLVPSPLTYSAYLSAPHLNADSTLFRANPDCFDDYIRGVQIRYALMVHKWS